jgi:integrase
MSYTVQKDFYLFSVNGIYYVQFRDPVTRKLRSKISTGMRNGTIADKWAREEFERRCNDIGKSDLVFRDYAERFYTDGCPHEAERKANGLTFGIKTRLNYRKRLTEYILPDPICNKLLCDITRPDTLNFRDRLIKKFGYTRKAQLILQAYKNILHTALTRGLINSDPVIKVVIRLQGKSKRQATRIDNVKNILLRENWENETLRLAAMTAGIVGLRAGELCALKWMDLNPNKKEIYVSRSWNAYEGEKGTKSNKPRITTYPEVLQAILEPLRGNPEEWVFSVKNGEVLSYDTLWRAMRKAAKKAKVEKITLHGLRHSINTALLESGVNPELLRASFGWVDEETQEIYTHRDLYNLTPQREATDKLFEGFIGE